MSGGRTYAHRPEECKGFFILVRHGAPHRTVLADTAAVITKSANVPGLLPVGRELSEQPGEHSLEGAGLIVFQATDERRKSGAARLYQTFHGSSPLRGQVEFEPSPIGGTPRALDPTWRDQLIDDSYGRRVGDTHHSGECVDARAGTRSDREKGGAAAPTHPCGCLELAAQPIGHPNGEGAKEVGDPSR